mmetsp:Transcript_17222/g.32595  ORF Transcript_17222/g.32595 Transcript_17222/m.32595 type:complete len:558 (+) Transcript_17222:73-1746(+)
MFNPSLKQRGRIRQNVQPTFGSSNGTMNQVKQEKGRGGSGGGGGPALALLLLGVFILAGLFFVEQSTHGSLRERIHQQQQEKRNKQTVILNDIPNDVVKITTEDDKDDMSISSRQQEQQEQQQEQQELEQSQELGTDSDGQNIYNDSNLKSAQDGRMYHLIFSTDCSEFQHWQSYLLFHSALKVQQPGTVTRIASGCKDDEKIQLQQWHKEHISNVMGERFMVHFTPHFSGVKDENGETVGDYKFFNKPFGLRHWLENALGFVPGSSQVLNQEDDVVILIDPDMVLLRPITGDFSNDRDVVIGRRHLENRKYKVDHGSPFAQKYGLGTQWRSFHLSDIAGPDSPALEVSQADGAAFYPVGPPYIGTVRDMHSISLKWTEFVPKVHKEYPYLLAEMYAFCIAAAHLKLPFQLIDSLMISNVGVGGEGWPMVDKLPEENLCEFAKRPQHDIHPVPTVIHYCQRYTIGEWFFSKRRMVKDFFECDSPLLEEPPMDVIQTTDYKHPPGGSRTELDPKNAKMEGFVVCGMIGALNDAAMYFKEHHCDGAVNFEKTLNLNQLH